MHRDLFALWPTPLEMAIANRQELEDLLTHIGLQRRRTLSLIRMSSAYSCWWDGRDPTELPGIGRYGADSYDLFIRGRLDIQPMDKELKKYLEWIRK